MNDDGMRKSGAPFILSRRKPVTVSSEDLVTTEVFDSTHGLPLVIRAQNADLDPIGWVKANRTDLAAHLLKHGAILLRGFAVNGPEQFRQVVESVSGAAIPYRERSSPRSFVMENIYTSTDYPSDRSILPHNEHSYAITFPQKLYFWCEIAARQGGETPLADTRRILARIDPGVVDKFREKGWMYVRNYTPHFGLSWQTAFQTDDRALVEAYCRDAAIEWEWTTHGLRTRQIRPAITTHPVSNESVWFNHAAFFHISSVEPELRRQLLAMYDERDFPTQTYYGDGSPIEDWVVQRLREAYANELVSFPWENGDAVIIDNMLTAHAREAYVGPRRILFAMAEPYTRTDSIGANREAH
jgi:alpha-ketoglutarate-dependent taurine dioxygenase